MSEAIERAIWKWRTTPVAVPSPFNPAFSLTSREGFDANARTEVYERDRFAVPDFVLVGRRVLQETRMSHPLAPENELMVAGVQVLYCPALPDNAVHVVTKFGSR